MSEPLEEWIASAGLEAFYEEVKTHCASAAPADVPRLVMTSLRQEIEMRTKGV